MNLSIEGDYFESENRRVLFDSRKYNQDIRVNKMMRNGVHQIKDIKSMKVAPNIELNKQLEIYRSNLNSFYNNKKVNVITEGELK